MQEDKEFLIRIFFLPERQRKRDSDRKYKNRSLLTEHPALVFHPPEATPLGENIHLIIY
jgi:hypothetical protein